jgi:iron-sulfur cluster repair protein YtfE (RIC family)
MITKDTTIEELVNDVPGAVKYLMDKGIRCIICGEPIWGTLEEAAEEKGFGEKEIEQFVKDLNEIQQNPPEEAKPLIDKKIDVNKLDTNKNK